MFAALTAELRTAGTSPLERLGELALEHGLHATDQWSVRFPDRAAGRPRRRFMAWSGPDRRTASAGGASPRSATGDGGDLPPADAVIWDFDDRTRVVFRPSGTEPKLKATELIGRGTRRYEAARARAAGARCAAGGAGRAAGPARAWTGGSGAQPVNGATRRS